jgi:hypothetical protein
LVACDKLSDCVYCGFHFCFIQNCENIEGNIFLLLSNCHDLLDLLLLNSLDKKALFDVHVKYFKLPSKTIHQNHL